jgi:hypothetical protein
MEGLCKNVISTCIYLSTFTINDILKTVKKNHERNVYTIINLFETIGVITKKEEKVFQWVGTTNCIEQELDSVLSKNVCDFISLVKNCEIFYLNLIAEKLNIKLRRFYDILKILIALGFITKKEPNVYMWNKKNSTNIPIKKRKII